MEKVFWIQEETGKFDDVHKIEFSQKNEFVKQSPSVDEHIANIAIPSSMAEIEYEFDIIKQNAKKIKLIPFLFLFEPFYLSTMINFAKKNDINFDKLMHAYVNFSVQHNFDKNTKIIKEILKEKKG